MRAHRHGGNSGKLSYFSARYKDAPVAQFRGTKMEDRGKSQFAKPEREEEDEIRRFFMGVMMGYEDNVIPPLSDFSPDFQGVPSTEIDSICRKRQRNRAPTPEYLIKERKRREEMSEKFSVLQSLVPTLDNAVKEPKDKIIDGAVNYIKHLEQEKERLEILKNSQRRETNVAKSFLTRCRNPSSSVKVNVSNGAKFLVIQLPVRRGLVAKIVGVLEKHKAEVLEARVNVNDQRMLTFTATIMLSGDGGTMIDKIKEEILNL